MTVNMWVLGLIAAFIALDLWLVVRLWRRARAARAMRMPRSQWLDLASRAANDDSLRGLLLLLRALDSESGAAPISVDWLLRQGTRDDSPKLLLKISWDGNEWRRLLALDETAASLTAQLAEEPKLASARTSDLLELLSRGRGSA